MKTWLFLSRPPKHKTHMHTLAPDVIHVLFYLVEPSGAATLAVVGTDVRQTGHFVYTVGDVMRTAWVLNKVRGHVGRPPRRLL